MVVRLYAVAFIAFATLLLGGHGIAVAADDSDPGNSGDSYSTPDAAEQPAAPDDGAVPPAEDDDGSATPPDDGGGEDADAPPPPADQE